MAVLIVQLVDAVVIHKGNADLRGTVELFKVQHSIAAAADEDTQP